MERIKRVLPMAFLYGAKGPRLFNIVLTFPRGFRLSMSDWPRDAGLQPWRAPFCVGAPG